MANHGEAYITLSRSLVVAAVKLDDMIVDRTGSVIVQRHILVAADGTPFVTAAKEIVDVAGMESDTRVAVNVGTRIVVR